ncbi:MAG: baseplate J/gp47 family protein [Clostridiales bacterium]|nr:baseplate J/gp47 family protein [Clostridiales bacterium]
MQKAGEITVMVNAPTMVESVVNEAAFYGGCNDETDSSYRQRILDNYMVPSNGMGRISIENKLNTLDYIRDCRVLDCVTPGTVSVMLIISDSDSISSERVQEIRDCLGFADITGISTSFSVASAVLLDVKCDISVESNADGESIQKEADEIIRDILGAEKIGEAISISSLMKPLLAIDGVTGVEIYCSDILSTKFVCPGDEYLKLNSLELNICYE